jgi:DNA-binding transcriptional LysR family regulator
MPGWRQLEGFFQVAKAGGYTRAAEQLETPVGQSAVYQQVRKLQDELGLALVRQAGPRATELTPEGRELFRFIAPFFEGLPRVLEGLRGQAPTPLLLAAEHFLAMETLPRALRNLTRDHPESRLRVEEVSVPVLLDHLLAGRVDAALAHVDPLPSGFAWTPLGEIGAALLLPLDHPLAASRRLPSAQALSEHPLILYEPGSPGRVLAERFFRTWGLRLTAAVEVSFPHTMRRLVEEGFAPAFVPHVLKSPAPKVASPDQWPDPRQVKPLQAYRDLLAFDLTPYLGGGLPYGLLYRDGMEGSLAFQRLLKALSS